MDADQQHCSYLCIWLGKNAEESADITDCSRKGHHYQLDQCRTFIYQLNLSTGKYGYGKLAGLLQGNLITGSACFITGSDHNVEKQPGLALNLLQ